MKDKNNFTMYTSIGIILGIIFNQLALGLSIGVVLGITLDNKII